MKTKAVIITTGTLLFLFAATTQSFAQFNPIIPGPDAIVATGEAAASASAEKQKQIEKIKEEDITKPEEEKAKKEFLALFSKRQIRKPSIVNFMGFFVQYAVRSGVPANTIILILLLPLLATLVVFVRNILGFPTLEMLVPIALSITLIATGPIAGGILLATILFASTISRYILKRIRIMQLPKMAISMLIVSVFVFGSLVISASFGLAAVTQLSFFPVLLLILLSDKIVALQLTRGTKPAIIITFFTLVLGSIGYAVLSIEIVRGYVLLYPEIILALIPLNLLLGRYFGLRLTELRRFSDLRRYVSQ